MKKLLTVLVCALAVSIGVPAWAQGFGSSLVELKVGYYSPSQSGLDGGALFGVELGKQFDENVSLAVELDYFGKTFDKKIDVAVDTSIIDVETSVTQVLYKHTVRYLPVLLNLSINIPLDPEYPVMPFISLVGGFQIARINYDFADVYDEAGVTDPPDEGWYKGWGWRIVAGGRYAVGSRSDLELGVLYNGITVKKSEEGGLERELDLKGVGFYGGIRLYTF